MEIINIQEAKKTLQSILPNTHLVPAILSKDRNEVKELLSVYLKVFDQIDFDVIDNTLFEGMLTLPADEYIEILHEIFLDPGANIKPKIGIHLMVADYETALLPHVIKRIDQVVIHFESLSVYDETIEDFFQELHSLNPDLQIGVAIAPRSLKEVHSILKFDKSRFEIFDLFQIMTVQPGMQGEKIIPEATELISDLKSAFPNSKIKVDGGISPEEFDYLTIDQIEIIKLCFEASVGSYFKNHARL